MTPLLVKCLLLSFILNINAIQHSVVTFNSLDTGFNVSSKISTVKPLEIVTIRITNITNEAKFALIQVHHQTVSMCLALIDPLANDLLAGDYVRGKDIGLVVNFEQVNETTANVWLINEIQLKLQVLIVVSLHTSSDPVPGGCNMEFEVEVSPFIKLKSDSVENRLEFQLARLGWPRGSSRPLPTCDISISNINYELYAYYLLSDDYSTSELYHGTYLMSNIDTIYSSGHRISSESAWSQKTRIDLFSYPGRGVIFNIVASFGHQRIPYVPISTYNCNFNPARLNSCGKMYQLLTIVTLIINGIIGLIMCVKGHTWFTLQVTWSSFYFSLIIGYILIAEQSKYDESTRELYSFAIAIIGSFVWTILWRIVRVKLIFVLTSGILLGLLMVSTLLFTVVGNEDLFRSDFNYWIIIACTSAAVPLLLLPFPTLMSIFATSIGGSYAFIFTIDRFIGSSIGFIILNILKRAAFKQLNFALNQIPFQGKDILMSILWMLLAFIGLFFQLHIESITAANRPRIIVARIRRSRRNSSRNRHRRSRSRNRNRSNGRRSQSTGRSRSLKSSKNIPTLTAVVTTRITNTSNVISNTSVDDCQPLII